VKLLNNVVCTFWFICNIKFTEENIKYCDSSLDRNIFIHQDLLTVKALIL
jgi:hypothetical protein